MLLFLLHEMGEAVTNLVVRLFGVYVVVHKVYSSLKADIFIFVVIIAVVVISSVNEAHLLFIDVQQSPRFLPTARLTSVASACLLFGSACGARVTRRRMFRVDFEDDRQLCVVPERVSRAAADLRLFKTRKYPTELLPEVVVHPGVKERIVDG